MLCGCSTCTSYIKWGRIHNVQSGVKSRTCGCHDNVQSGVKSRTGGCHDNVQSGVESLMCGCQSANGYICRTTSHLRAISEDGHFLGTCRIHLLFHIPLKGDCIEIIYTVFYIIQQEGAVIWQ